MPCSRCGLYKCGGYAQHMTLEEMIAEAAAKRLEQDQPRPVWAPEERRQYRIKKLESELAALKAAK